MMAQQQPFKVRGLATVNFYAADHAGEIAYWHVDDLQAALDHLVGHGATPHRPITDHSGGKGNFVTASVVDPFGNIFGVMTSKHYLDVFAQNSR